MKVIQELHAMKVNKCTSVYGLGIRHNALRQFIGMSLNMCIHAIIVVVHKYVDQGVSGDRTF